MQLVADFCLAVLDIFTHRKKVALPCVLYNSSTFRLKSQGFFVEIPLFIAVFSIFFNFVAPLNESL